MCLNNHQSWCICSYGWESHNEKNHKLFIFSPLLTSTPKIWCVKRKTNRYDQSREKWIEIGKYQCEKNAIYRSIFCAHNAKTDALLIWWINAFVRVQMYNIGSAFSIILSLSRLLLFFSIHVDVHILYDTCTFCCKQKSGNNIKSKYSSHLHNTTTGCLLLLL